MSKTGIARLFRHGRSQAVRLPKEFRLPGEAVRVTRVGNGVLLEPIETDITVWFANLDRFVETPFMPEGREQPAMPINQFDLV
ncbi:AbrB/MazE/SpoVT family DNA-binding domain-containing protein [Mycobacterium sp. KBS0706]|uniref:antitoxin n=1 Tax=Mycobacterium sp. KBS0706 TaxID=2578109 RepID=UPI00110FB8BF|nr:type II toxin-antitoxin system VapB family antitoxin [Mycobacterium sp. KBS0706]TSD88892.1 AbrB/MazE/SpoVT family DNA-binding domain-containing protein [Mycobacterium sp. KBS0706]